MSRNNSLSNHEIERMIKQKLNEIEFAKNVRAISTYITYILDMPKKSGLCVMRNRIGLEALKRMGVNDYKLRCGKAVITDASTGYIFSYGFEPKVLQKITGCTDDELTVLVGNDDLNVDGLTWHCWLENDSLILDFDYGCIVRKTDMTLEQSLENKTPCYEHVEKWFNELKTYEAYSYKFTGSKPFNDMVKRVKTGQWTGNEVDRINTPLI